MKPLELMTADERSLLLYLETRAVDYGGRVDTRYMNADDMVIAKKWDEEGFIKFGRIVFRHHNRDGTHWVILSTEAWRLAHEERIARFNRLWEKKDWLSTEDSSEVYGHPHLSGMNRPAFTHATRMK